MPYNLIIGLIIINVGSLGIFFTKETTPALARQRKIALVLLGLANIILLIGVFVKVII